MLKVIYAWAARSSHGSTTYEVLLMVDGSMSCSCPGWIYAKKGQPRSCRHTREHEAAAQALLTRARQGLPIMGQGFGMVVEGTTDDAAAIPHLEL